MFLDVFHFQQPTKHAYEYQKQACAASHHLCKLLFGKILDFDMEVKTTFFLPSKLLVCPIVMFSTNNNKEKFKCFENIGHGRPNERLKMS